MKKPFKFDKSLKLFSEALKYLPAGVGSNARLWRSGICPPGLPCSIFISHAKGAYIWDVDGNKYIDYRLGFGPVILGHAYDKVNARVRESMKNGVIYGAGHELEIKVAKKICSLMPCAEMVRFSNAGTEATMNAIRVARAVTKKDKIIKFEGHFHGNHDYLLWSTEPPFELPAKPVTQTLYPQSWGIPNAVKDTLIVDRWNDFEAIEKTVKMNKDDVAAIITEPIMGNAAAIMPKPGYLKHLRELCDRYGLLLIFDEVKTGFRVDLGGAQKLFKITPDLAAIGKAMGNGYPVSALVGKMEYMESIGPGKVAQGGTYASNPLSLTAVDATLDELKRRNAIEHIRKMGTILMKGLDQIFDDLGVHHLINGVPGMFEIAFTRKEEINEWRDLRFCELKMYSFLHSELLKKGIIVDADIEEPIFLSFSHKKEEIEKTLEAYAASDVKIYGKIEKMEEKLR